MKKIIAVAALSALAPLGMALPLVDIAAGAGGSMPSLDEGMVANNAVFLTEGDELNYLNMNAGFGYYAWANVGVPLLPKVRVKYQSLVMSGSNNVTFTESILGKELAFNGNVDSSLDLSHVDAIVTLGLGLPIPFLKPRVDVGLNGRAFLGSFEYSSDAAVTFDGEPVETDGAGQYSGSYPFEIVGMPPVIPMGYASAEVNIPFTGIRVKGEYSTLQFVTDLDVRGTFYLPLPLKFIGKIGVEAGYKQFNLDIPATLEVPVLGSFDTSDYQTKVSISGIYAGATVAF
jgi:hypothetical protein